MALVFIKAQKKHPPTEEDSRTLTSLLMAGKAHPVILTGNVADMVEARDMQMPVKMADVAATAVMNP